MPKLIIAIDGTAASGKSTTARLVAKRLNYLYIDTGAMYRAAAYAVARNKINPDDRQEVERLLQNVSIRLVQKNGNEVYLDGEEVTNVIRTSEITNLASKISTYEGVRNKMVEEQRAMAAEGGVVLEGRDIGTVVFPNADLKFFFIADVTERAKRRVGELSTKGEKIIVDDVVRDIKKRDHEDSTRKVSPLRKADDAIVIDTSNLSIEEQVEEVLSRAREKLNAKNIRKDPGGTT